MEQQTLFMDNIYYDSQDHKRIYRQEKEKRAI